MSEQLGEGLSAGQSQNATIFCLPARCTWKQSCPHSSHSREVHIGQVTYFQNLTSYKIPK